jgi:integrase
LRLILLTAARPGEVAGMRRDEIRNLDNPDSATWEILGVRTKNGRAHYVPLSAIAAETVRAAQELVEDDCEYVFPSPVNRAASITSNALGVAMRRFAASLQNGGDAGKTWRHERPSPHDLRRTVRTRLSSLGIAERVCDALMNHVRGDVGNKHYNVHDYADEKREALGRWAAAVVSIIDRRSAAVVPIDSARKKARK